MDQARATRPTAVFIAAWASNSPSRRAIAGTGSVTNARMSPPNRVTTGSVSGFRSFDTASRLTLF